jgi:hypothetical protein
VSVYKVTTIWNQSVMGVSETWYTPDQSDASIQKTIQQMIALRSNCMYQIQPFVGIRVSLYGAKRQSKVILPPGGPLADPFNFLQVPATGTLPGGTSTTRPDQLRAVIQLTIAYNNTRRTLRYLSGIPDAYSVTEPATFNPGAAGAWGTAFDQWRSYLVNTGWQIQARLLTGDYTPAPVIGVTVQAAAPSLLGIVVVAATAPAFAQGQKVALSHFRPKKGTRDLTVNGMWTIDSVNTTLVPGNLIVYLRNSSGIDPDSVRFTANSTIQRVGYGLFPVQSINPYRVGIHKRGRPSLAPRGRRLSRPTLDP